MSDVGQKLLRCVFLFALLTGCQVKEDGQPPEVETAPSHDYSVQTPPKNEAVEVTLVTFVESQVEVPDRENRGRLILSNGCITVQLEHSSTSYVPIFQNSTRVVRKDGQVIGVSVGQQFIQINVPFRFGGAIVRSLEQIPAITDIPENCNLQIHSIGSVEL